MDYQIDPNTGLYTISLGGIVWNNCTTDAECPGRAVCMVNETWLSSPSMCICPPIYDLTGAECESTTAYGEFCYVTNIVLCIYGIIFFLVGLLNVLRMVRTRMLHADATSTSLIFAVIALGFSAAATGAVTRFIVLHPIPDALGSKRTEIESSLLTPATLGGSFFFTNLSMLNISLVWLEIAEHSQRVAKGGANRVQIINIKRYRWFLISYYVIFVLLVIISLMALNDFVLAAVSSLPAVLIVTVTYIVGYFKMRQVLIGYTNSKGVHTDMISGQTGKAAISKIRDSLTSIKYATISISFFVMNFVIWTGVWIGMGGFAQRPGRGFSLIPVTVVWVWILLTNVAVMLYLHVVISRKLKALAARSTTDVQGSIVAQDAHEMAQDNKLFYGRESRLIDTTAKPGNSKVAVEGS